MRVRVRPHSRRIMVDLLAFKELPYLLFNVGLFVSFMGAYTPFYYLQLFAADRQITSGNLALYLVAILNSTSTVGRILPNLLADRIGPFNMIVPCATICGILILCLLAVNLQRQLLAVTALYGFFSGSFVSLSPSILIALCPNQDVVGTRIGMSFTVMGVGLLIGTPVAGKALDSGFSGMWIYGGILTTTGGLIMCVSRGVYSGWSWIKKV